MTINLIFV